VKQRTKKIEFRLPGATKGVVSWPTDKSAILFSTTLLKAPRYNNNILEKAVTAEEKRLGQDLVNLTYKVFGPAELPAKPQLRNCFLVAEVSEQANSDFSFPQQVLAHDLPLSGIIAVMDGNSISRVHVAVVNAGMSLFLF
jgi:hypothetical protein